MTMTAYETPHRVADGARVDDVAFYFDPTCPWTWLTSRWLVRVAEERRFDVRWDSLSLGVLNGGYDTVPPQWRASMLLGRDAHRIIQALLRDGRNDDIGAFYAAFGHRRFGKNEEPSRDLLVAAARDAGVQDVLDAADDASLDPAIEESTRKAMAMVGPDVGSPVLVVNGHAIFGPIVSPVPDTEEALRLWDALTTLNDMGEFFELKRGRQGPPDLRSA